VQPDERPAHRAQEPGETRNPQPDAGATPRLPHKDSRPEAEQQESHHEVCDCKREPPRRACRNLGADAERDTSGG
jgi:hypothetical protein